MTTPRVFVGFIVHIHIKEENSRHKHFTGARGCCLLGLSSVSAGWFWGPKKVDFRVRREQLGKKGGIIGIFK